MKCPKCNYVSHDYLDACRKCGIDLVTFKQEIGLLVLQPGVLDLSLILGGADADDLFESVAEEATLRASDDDDFDISLDDYAEHPGIRRAPAGTPRFGRPQSETDLAGMDHLTLELDSSDMPAEMTARLRAARVLPDEPPPVPTQPPAEPGAPTLPGHVTLDMRPESVSGEFSAVIPQGIVPFTPSSSQEVTVPLEPPSVHSLQLDVSRTDLAPLPPVDAPETERIDTAGVEGIDEAVSIVDSSGSLASLPLQDVVLAEDTPTASAEPKPEGVEPTLPTIELRDTARPSAPEEAEEATGLLSSLDLDLSTLAEAEATLSDLAAPTLPEAPFTLPDEALPRPPSVGAETSTGAETPPEGLLTSSDMFALEHLEDPMTPEHLTLELEPLTLPADLASRLHEDVTPTSLPGAPDIPETFASAGPEPDLPPVETLAFADLDETALPGHLTLELDNSEMALEVSSIVLDDPQPDNPPGDIQSTRSPHDAQADDGEELLLDLDDMDLDDDEPA